MIWLLWKLLTLPIRVVFGTISAAFKTIRFVGISRILAFGAGVGVGLSVAPTSGEQFRARLADGYGSASSAAGDLGETVRYELAHSPRTWHLPQPVVSVEGNRVTLTGEVPHETARGDLGRTAGAVVGVAAVDNRVTVAAT
jgi:hypothetical protein